MPPSFDLLHCPVCDAADQGFTPLDPGTLTGFPAVQCRGCGLGIEQTLSADPVGPYARDAYDAARNAGAGGARWRRFHHDTAVAAARLAQLGPSLPTGTAWVDVGCSAGALLALLRRRGWQVLGVEADPATASEVTQALGVPVVNYQVWFSNAHRSYREDQKADVVSFFDVVEHLLDPVGTLQAAAAGLHNGGALVVEVPDLDAGLSGAEGFAKWKHRRISEAYTEHVFHFSERSLEQLRVRHLKHMVQVRLARPVEGRLQVVWRKDLPPVPPDNTVTPSAIAVELHRRPRHEQVTILDRMRRDDPALHQEVAAAFARLTESKA